MYYLFAAAPGQPGPPRAPRGDRAGRVPPEGARIGSTETALRSPAIREHGPRPEGRHHPHPAGNRPRRRGGRAGAGDRLHPLPLHLQDLRLPPPRSRRGFRPLSTTTRSTSYAGTGRSAGSAPTSSPSPVRCDRDRAGARRSSRTRGSSTTSSTASRSTPRTPTTRGAPSTCWFSSRAERVSIVPRGRPGAARPLALSETVLVPAAVGAYRVVNRGAGPAGSSRPSRERGAEAMRTEAPSTRPAAARQQADLPHLRRHRFPERLVRRGIQVDPVGVAHRGHAARVEEVGAERDGGPAVMNARGSAISPAPPRRARRTRRASRAAAGRPGARLAASRRARPRCAGRRRAATGRSNRCRTAGRRTGPSDRSCPA